MTTSEHGCASNVYFIFYYGVLSCLGEPKSILLPRDGASTCPSPESIRVELPVFDGGSQHWADLRQLQLEEAN